MPFMLRATGESISLPLAVRKAYVRDYLYQQQSDLCGPTVMPPLQLLSDTEAVRLRQMLAELLEKDEIQL